MATTKEARFLPSHDQSLVNRDGVGRDMITASSLGTTMTDWLVLARAIQSVHEVFRAHGSLCPGWEEACSLLHGGPKVMNASNTSCKGTTRHVP